MIQAKAVTRNFTVSADLIRGIVDCAERCGVARNRLSDMIDRDGTATAKSSARYSGVHILKLWDRILRETNDPIIGFRMARTASVKTFGHDIANHVRCLGRRVGLALL